MKNLRDTDGDVSGLTTKTELRLGLCKPVEIWCYRFAAVWVLQTIEKMQFRDFPRRVLQEL
jgi:hypothetical protein